ncbi:MAG TPA: HAD family phosphatase [Solirubrobacterales bacterium]|nr:HAD family phosphatase [Solirubrobacterales bacterium]
MAEPPITKITTVISDFGGVLTTPLLAAFSAFQDDSGISPESLGKAMRVGLEEEEEIPLFQLERGEISEDEFLRGLEDGLETILGHRPHLHHFRQKFWGALEPNEPVIELMRELKASGLKMAMLTNNVREWEPLWRSMLPVDEIFEEIVDSGFVGRRKPEARIYELTLERIGVAAEHCLFVDDLQVNCEGAEAAGMRAVHFRDNEQAIAEIRAALGPARAAG